MTSDFSGKLPQIPDEHIIGDRALDVFRFRKKRDWIPTSESRRDYGWDILLTIREKELASDDFFVQLKGHKKPNYNAEKEFMGESLAVSTVRWLMQKTVPSMLCVCDIGQADEPIYYVWLKEAVEEVEKSTPHWQVQDTVTLRVPLCNRLNENSYEFIEEYVRDYFTQLRINETIGQVFFQKEQFSPDVLRVSRSNPDEFVINNIAPKLMDTGLIDIIEDAEDKTIIQGLSEKDREIFKKLSEVSSFLAGFNDGEAKRLFDTLNGDDEDSPNIIKARYYSCKGMLALHYANDDEASDWIEKAYYLRPHDRKIATNYVFMQYHSVKGETGATKKAEKLLIILDEIINSNPDFWSAIRLKAYLLSEISTVEKAFDWLRLSSALEKDPLESRVCMAEIYKEHGQLGRAISIMSEIEPKAISFDEGYYAMYGFLLFSKGIGNVSLEADYIIHGYGSALFDLDLIKKALGFYEKAYSLLSSKGFPILFEHAVINYAGILDLLGMHPKSEVILHIYLYHHPDSTLGNAALANALFKQAKNYEAVRYAEKAFLNDEESSPALINYVLLLYLTEQYDELLKVVSRRIEGGFRSKKEEGISRVFAAMAYKELGLMKFANEQLEVLRHDEDLKVDATIGSAYLIEDKDKVVAIYKQGLKDYPDDKRLLTNYLAELMPVKRENAAELKDMLSRIRKGRQLIPEEYYALGRANLLLELPEESEKVVREGMERYPDEHRFIFEHAEALYRLGYEEECYKELSHFLNEGKKDYSLLKNLAIVAMNTDRIDEAVRFLTLALKKATSDIERGDIHCQLYELKKLKQYPPKELLAHVVEVGKVSRDMPEMEARYLSLFMTSPGIPTEELDEEVNVWVKDYRDRLESFTEKYPNFPTFKMFSLPKDASDDEQVKDFLSTMAFMTLPHELATASVKIATRSGEWPLTFRAKLLYSQSIFEYWSFCTKSDESQHAIHIWSPFNNLQQEVDAAKSSKRMCVDLSAFLTLAEFDLLAVLSDLYEQIIISHETKALLRQVVLGYKRTHPLAMKIWEWIKENRTKIRTRSVTEEDNDEEYVKRDSGLFMQTNRSPKQTFDDGIGETLMLAKGLSLPLFSDEAAIRQMGRDNYKLQVVSTIGLVIYLNQVGKISLSNVTRLFSEMINKNFRIVPFTAEHLQERLREKLCAVASTGKRYLKSEVLQSDEVLAPFMKQVGDYSLYKNMVAIASDWWVAILMDPDVAIEQLDECVSYLSYILSMKTVSSVIQKVFVKEQEERIAAILAFFLWKTYLRLPDRLNQAWSASKTCCNRYFSDHGELLQFELIPKHLKKIIEDAILSPLEKSVAIYNIE